MKKQIKNLWIDASKELPKVEGYYEVLFDNGMKDEKPFRIRPSKNIYGFMTEEKVIKWK
jgi:hypothetical protein